MKFEQPATKNPIDEGRVVGRSQDRIDGPLKVTGTAPYAYERHDMAPSAAYGWIVGISESLRFGEQGTGVYDAIGARSPISVTAP